MPITMSAAARLATAPLFFVAEEALSLAARRGSLTAAAASAGASVTAPPVAAASAFVKFA
jgi:hypothetical protein